MNPRLDQRLFRQLCEQARSSPRRRAHLNLHHSFDDPVQRLCIGLTEGTYVRPHAHPQAHKWELILALQGTTCLVIFEADGRLRERLLLAPEEPTGGIELAPGTWHTLYPADAESVILEIKQGPYDPSQAATFPDWAPEEASPAAARYLAWLRQAHTGQEFSKMGNG